MFRLGGLHRAARTSLTTKNGKVVPQATVTPDSAAASREGQSGRALLGWTRFGSPGIFG